ncbi:MAG: serine hydrolase domain-containing protein [Caulobacteraceae bacterium]
MTVPPPVARLQTMLDDHVDNFGAVGVLVGIDVPRTPPIYVAAGHRVIGGEPLTAKHMYQIGSQTKTFVAVAILQLCREGVIALDDPVVRCLDLPLDPRITVRHLITNTSGVPEFLGRMPETSLREFIAPRQILASVLGAEPLFTPGERFDYSNSGWVLAALVLDAKAPGGYAGFVRDRIFKPAGLDHSYVAQGFPRGRLAMGYVRGPGAATPEPADAGFSMSWAYGAGDIVSSADDMLAFFRTLATPDNPLGFTLDQLTAERFGAGPKPVHPSSLGGEYAFGLERRVWGGLEVWGHPGRTPGYGASTWIAPLNGVIVTTAYMYVADVSEAPAVALQRYDPPLVFTQALATAHALADRLAA